MGKVSHVIRPVTGQSASELEAPGATRGVQGRVIGRSGECDQGGAEVVEEPNDIASGVIEWLLNPA